RCRKRPRSRRNPARDEPVLEPIANATHVAGQPVLPLRREACSRAAPILEVVPPAPRRAGGGPGTAAAMHERRVHHRAAPACLAHGEREITVVPVEEAIALVEAAYRFEDRPPEEQAHSIDRGDLLELGTDRPGAFQTVHERSAGESSIGPPLAPAVESGQADAGTGLDSGLQPPEPPGIAHLGVVVQEAEGVAAGQARALVERADQPDVLVVAVIRVWTGQPRPRE